MAVSEFLKEKYRKAFRFFDMNKDGYWDIGDFEILAANISKIMNATEDEKSQTRQNWVKWMGLLHPDPKSPMSEDQFLEAAIALHCDTEKHKVHTRDTYSMLFDNLDRNKDDRISYEELKIYYEAHGVKDEAFIRKVFDQLDAAKTGYIERNELVTAGVNYWWAQDEKDGYSFIYDQSIE